MALRTIYFDESGFTGSNLLDPAQPVFAIASADIEEACAEGILRASFPHNKADEHHFTRIWKSKRQRNGLRVFCRHLHEVEGKAFCYVVNKRFAVFASIMHYLVGPTVTEAGYDYYDDGFCRRYANYVHFGLTQFAPPELLDCLLTYYQEFSRAPTHESLLKLQFRLRMMANSVGEPVDIFFNQMAEGAKLLESYKDIETFRRVNNMHASTMIVIIERWRQAHPEDFAVVHDTSSAFLRDRRIWKAMTAPDAPWTKLKAGDGSLVPYPLRVISTEARNSHESFSIQFCDILAGLMAKHFNPGLNDEERAFMSELVGEGLGKVRASRMIPGGEFPIHFPPKRLDGPDAIDQIREIIRKRPS